jgi:2-phosphosulfolactate phosphatase
LPNSVTIECFQENPTINRDGYAVVAIDVIRATTSAITAAAAGWRCFPVPSLEAALFLQRELPNSVLAGEVSGDTPHEFELNNSPAEIAARVDNHRPLILLSSSGTKLIHAARHCEFVYLACFRNFAALSQHLIYNHPKVLLIGAGTRGEFREEDQICCAWIARELIEAGYLAETDRTSALVDRWGGASVDACLCSKSVAYLRRSGQIKDLDFTLAHVDDLCDVFMVKEGEVIKVTTTVPVECPATGSLVSPL